MSRDLLQLMTGELLDDEVEMTLAELCRVFGLTQEEVCDLVEHGIAEPRGRMTAQWRFTGVSVRRVRCAQRLRRDLDVNIAGAALALDLLEELDALRQRLGRFEG